jgi:hypothetical protein
MEPWYPMLEEYDKDHWARYIEEGRVTRIVNFFCTLILAREMWKLNKHFCMSL